MASTDIRGVPVSSDNRGSMERFEEALGLLHGFYNDPLEVIDGALAQDPEFIIGHCLRAGMMMVSSEAGAVPEIRKDVEAAEALADKANERERGHIAAARAWLDGDFHKSTAILEQVSIENPRDILALQVGHLCDFLLGQSSMLRDRIARALPAWDESVPGYNYVLGMHAFGLEEMNDYGRAEETARRALELNPRDPWAVHAGAHVMEMQGRLAEGIDWLTSRSDDWAPDNGFAFHNWWHLALYHLDLGQNDRVLELYDQKVRPERSDVLMELVDAASLLWRLHLRDIDVGTRWVEMADTYEPMVEDAYYAFNDLHAMMSFVATGRDDAAGMLMAAVEKKAAQANGTSNSNAAMTRDVGLPSCRAFQAFGQGDYATTVELLLPLRPIAHRFGGSHAQRDVLSLTLIEAALRGGQPALAQALMAERKDLKPASPWNWATTARTLEAAGDKKGAEHARLKAASLTTEIHAQAAGRAA